MAKKKVLLVDDDMLTRKMVTNLMQYDCEMVLAANGAEGLGQIKDHPGEISVIITDLVMPVMDGYDMIQMIHEDPVNKYIPILVITALTGEEELKKAFAYGVEDIVTKPLIAEVARQRIKNMLELADSRMIHNVIEDLVRVEIEENIETLGICPCPICRRDLMTLTLNHIPPKYVSTERGAILSMVNGRTRDEKIKLLAEVAKYAQMVREKPRHPVNSI